MQIENLGKAENLKSSEIVLITIQPTLSDCTQEIIINTLKKFPPYEFVQGVYNSVSVTSKINQFMAQCHNSPLYSVNLITHKLLISQFGNTSRLTVHCSGFQNKDTLNTEPMHPPHKEAGILVLAPSSTRSLCAGCIGPVYTASSATNYPYSENNSLQSKCQLVL